jgi:hypothetical protein
MANHEHKSYSDSVDIFMALSRTKDGQPTECFRVVAKDAVLDMAILELRCKHAGGKWRIHKTVNRRDTEKARIWLLHKLIDFPDGRGFVDSLWRTALLQTNCIYGEKKFMLDVDTKEEDKLCEVRELVGDHLIEAVETENGWHFITRQHDTRKVCELDYVELQRDGYVYVKTIGGNAQ